MVYLRKDRVGDLLGSVTVRLIIEGRYLSASRRGGSGARKVVGRYTVGVQVMVFYNLQNPSEAVLERKAPAQWIMWLLLAVFDCALCGVIPLL